MNLYNFLYYQQRCLTICYQIFIKIAGIKFEQTGQNLINLTVFTKLRKIIRINTIKIELATPFYL